MGSIYVLIIDEHKQARQSLARRLTTLSDIEVVGVTGNHEEGLRKIEELIPDVVLLDIKMRHADGMNACRRACSTNSNTKVLVLTTYGDPQERRDAYRAGISGYLLKEIDTRKLAERIRRLVVKHEVNAGVRSL